jgi:hypothetical protein
MSLLSAMVFSFTGCTGQKKRVGISWLSVKAATGDRHDTNCVILNNNWGESEYTRKHEAVFSSDSAMKLIDEINALPDIYGDENDDPSYMISLSYYDADGNSFSLWKNGYGIFPDNWEQIITYTNEIADGRDSLSYSTDLVRVDEELLKTQFGMTEDMLPEGVTIEKFIEDTKLTYFDLYGNTSAYAVDSYVRNYKYDYYNLASRKIHEDTAPSVSDKLSLEEYAKENLDSIISSDDIFVTGTFMDQEFQIVRFDNFADWKHNSGGADDVVHNDGTVDICYLRDAGCEGMTYSEEYMVFVDASNRFLIITEEGVDYDIINAYFNR